MTQQPDPTQHPEQYLKPGPHVPAEEPKRKRRKWPYVVGGILAIALIGSALGGDEDDDPTDPSVADTPQADEVEADESIADPEEEGADEGAEDADPEPEEEPTEEPEPDRFEIEHDDDDLGGAVPGGTTFVRFDIADNFSRGMIASGAESDTFEALELALEEHPDTGRVAIEGSFPTVDDYGNESDSVILRPFYERETLDQINFDNRHAVDIWAIRDGGMVHPDLEG